MKYLKICILVFTTLVILGFVLVYITLRASLPTLSGKIVSDEIAQAAVLARDTIGTAVVHASDQYDAAYVLAFAHAQDRLFQMDVLRRTAAGELSVLFGDISLPLDKKHRIHQFRKRAKSSFEKLSDSEKRLLQQYTAGVNAGAQSLAALPFEYYAIGAQFTPWEVEDSLLVIYSMYIDLQLRQTEVDFALTALRHLYGEAMHQFFTLPSPYQSAIDNSKIPLDTPEIPSLYDSLNALPTIAYNHYDSIKELADIGSNNWAVSAQHTKSKSAMLSTDMHLGLRVPAIWYRTQLNYSHNTQKIEATGLSLPGSPGLIVGSNKHLAWGFTNANINTEDWIKLDDSTSIQTIEAPIYSKENKVDFSFQSSAYGPVREFAGKKYALKWLAHQSYALNLKIADMASAVSVKNALEIAKTARIPVLNMVVADSSGDIAWQLTGAISARTNAKRYAVSESEFSSLWEKQSEYSASSIKLETEKVWTANARVVSTKDLSHFGDSGYALGARQFQIGKLLSQKDTFTEQDFYDIQTNNEAKFLIPWHHLLQKTLSNSPRQFAKDLAHLNNWKACACADSIGYTLVRRFRSTVINQLIEPIDKNFKVHELNARYLLGGIEPAIWAIINARSEKWLPKPHRDYQQFLSEAYLKTKQRLLNNYSQESRTLDDLTWGKVNALAIRHPLAGAFGAFENMLNMPVVEAYGDSYMPAVQAKSFGASQRLIVRPGDLESGILTLPGGQSGHFLSPYFRTGFEQYAKNKNTPLLPQSIEHKIDFLVKANTPK